MQSGNPAFAGTIWQDWAYADRRGRVMTVEGTAMKSLALLVVLTITAAFAWTQADKGALNGALVIGGLFGGLVFFIATMVKKTWAPITAPLYAACEGLLLGAISNVANVKFPGIATQAVALTFGVTFVMMFLYGARVIRVTNRLAMGIVAATGGVALVYVVGMLLSFFGVMLPIFNASPVGILFSLFVVGLAAFNLLLDFDFIEQGARAEAPKYMEWYGAFGLMVTLIWLYLEILRLLVKLQSRRD